MSTKIAFFGSSEYSIIILSKLLEIPDFSTICVVTKPDKALGREQVVTANPVAEFAHKQHLPLLQPEDFTPEFISQYRALSPDLALCVAFGPPFFDQQMIDIPPYKIVNIHPSPLPKYRGATPGPWQIFNGETASAVTFFQIDALPDHGPIITQIPFSISTTETSPTFYEKAFALAAQQLEPILKSYLANPQTLLPQDHTQKTYFPKFNKAAAVINWTWPPAKIERFIRAMLPWPIAWTTVKDQKGKDLTMKILSAAIFNQQLEIKSVQIEGKKITQWSEISKYYQIIKD